MKLLFVSFAALVAAGAAQAADLPTRKAPAIPAPIPVNCFSSVMSYLNSSAADCPLTWNGITLFGTVDVGGAYQSEGAPFNSTMHTGIEELINKNASRSQYTIMPNGLSQSTLGIKVEEKFATDWAIIGDYDFGFDPYTGLLASGPDAQIQNYGRTGALIGTQNSNADSSRAGQFDNGQLYGGISNKYFGNVVAGRINSLTLDGVNSYDPMGGSYAYSVIGWSGTTAGVGDTEDARFNTAVRYRVAYNNFRFGAEQQFGGYSYGNGSQGATQIQFGGDFGGFSGDIIYSYVRDAVSASVQSVPFPSNSLAATLSNDQSIMLLGKYVWKPVTLYGGFEAIRYQNPSNPGITSFHGENNIFFTNLSTKAYTIPKNLDVFWGGAKYAVRDDVDLVGAYYEYYQPDYSGTGCTNNSKGSCRGYLNAVSGLIDWRPFKRLDIYAGLMYSQVSGGLSNGYLHNNTIDPSAGLRFRF